ncbi:MAG: iron ABC transporter permease [Chloroflexota bacterium]|nr:iron ABC transporter permease [Chloroflexota bacterium]
MNWRKFLLIGLIFTILFTFILYPIIVVLIQSFGNDGEIGIGNYIKVFSDPYFKQAIINSIPVSLLSSIISTLLGLIIALVVFKTKLSGRKVFGFAAILPMVIPGFALTLAYVFLFGRNGLITYKLLNITWNIYSWRSVLILQGLSISTTFFLISSVLVGVDSRVEDAARNLGSSEWKVFTTVTLPLIFPAVISSMLLAFLRSLADFSTPYILGGSFNTLATEAYSQLIGTYNTPLASALSMILLIISILVFWLYTRSQKSSEKVRTKSEGQPPKMLKLGKVISGLMWLVSFLYTIVIVLLLAAIVLSAFTKYLGGDFELTLEHIKILPNRGWNSTRNSLIFASITSFIVTAFGLVLAYIRTRFNFKANRFLDLLATMPYAIPGTFMGIGYALAFSRKPLLLSGTWMIVVACTVIREIPMGLRAGVNVLMQQDRSVEDAAANLGASKLRAFFDIIVPAARPAILVTSLYAFIATVKTLGAIIFLMTPSNKVLSSDVFEATVRGDIGEASALSLVVILVCAVGMLLIYAINSREAAQKWFRNTIANITTK